MLNVGSGTLSITGDRSCRNRGDPRPVVPPLRTANGVHRRLIRDSVSPRRSPQDGNRLQEPDQAPLFEPIAIPGLLQTPDYTRAVIKGGAQELGHDEIEQLVEAPVSRFSPSNGDQRL
ncbi:Scr1 family TA system antitoxin-like transcriptional regulator [Streptosporangium roseum]|uniref:Scr1 family TA system antitoxin-like transcriptional regulator n=1 Tax=Streptosporangium roseum TaxID=2001 RepID=UPI003326863E